MVCNVDGCDRAGKITRGMCSKHYSAFRTANPDKCGWGSAEERFWAALGGKRTDASPCWVWGKHLDAYGYGSLSVDGKATKAHRFAWRLLRGEIPGGLDLDHLCRVRDCVNPWHLEPVTRGENVRRGNAPAHVLHRTGVCKNGHSLEDAYVNSKTGWRRCRTCAQEARRAA